MSAWRRRLAEQLDTVCSTWLFRAYGRPLWFLVGMMLLPPAVVLGVTYHVNATVARTQALHNLLMVAQLTSKVIGSTLSDTPPQLQPADVESIRSVVQQVRMDPEGFLYVADQRSQLVVYPFQVSAGGPKPASDWPPVAQPVSASGHALMFREEGRPPPPKLLVWGRGKRWLAGVHPIGTTGWRVVAVQPDEAALRLLHQTLWPLGVLIVLLLAVVVVVGRRWAALQELNLRLLEQNTKLLKESQQRWTLERGKSPT